MLRQWDKYSILPALAANVGAFTDLRFRELSQPVLSREICLITRRLRSLSPGSQRLLEVLMKTIREQKLPASVGVLSSPSRSHPR